MLAKYYTFAGVLRMLAKYYTFAGVLRMLALHPPPPPPPPGFVLGYPYQMLWGGGNDGLHPTGDLHRVEYFQWGGGGGGSRCLVF